MQAGRAKPVDVLAKYINSENDPDAVEMNEPYFYLMGLTLTDLEDLVADIQVRKSTILEADLRVHLYLGHFFPKLCRFTRS